MKAHNELFFERFLEYNLERYKNNPTYLNLFTNLTYQEVIISSIIPTMNGERRSATVTSATRRFKGINQSWTPAKAGRDPNLYNLLNVDPLPDLETVQKVTTPGMYSYMDGTQVKIMIVIPFTTQANQVDATLYSLFNNAIRYQVTRPTLVDTTYVVDGDTYTGPIEWIRAASSILIIPDTDYQQLWGKVIS